MLTVKLFFFVQGRNGLLLLAAFVTISSAVGPQHVCPTKPDVNSTLQILYEDKMVPNDQVPEMSLIYPPNITWPDWSSTVRTLITTATDTEGIFLAVSQSEICDGNCFVVAVCYIIVVTFSLYLAKLCPSKVTIWLVSVVGNLGLGFVTKVQSDYMADNNI